jgi:hypothetical protein
MSEEDYFFVPEFAGAWTPQITPLPVVLAWLTRLLEIPCTALGANMIRATATAQNFHAPFLFVTVSPIFYCMMAEKTRLLFC